MGFDYANEVKERYPIVKWDIVFNIIIIAFALWASGKLYLQIIALIVFLQVYVVSFFIFHYWKIWVPLILVCISAIFWLAYLIMREFIIVEVVEAMLFVCIATSIYSLFWFVIWRKNHYLHLKALRPKPCPVCGEEKEEHIIHLGQDMCVQCFEKQAIAQVFYHDEIVYKWDFDVLNYLEAELEKPIPILDAKLNYMSPKEVNAEELFGAVIEDKNISRLYLNHQNLKNLPPFIGLLLNLVELHVRNNQLAKLPTSLINLANLRVLDYRGNPLEFRSGDVERALLNLTRKNCLILED